MSGASNIINDAVAILRRGGLVAFPTETVYGLGGDARNAAAIARIFAAKGRPATNPLIVHVADRARAMRYAASWSQQADALAAAFWPGALTLVVPRGGDIVDAVTAGLASVGLRCPDHRLTLDLLAAFDGPLAGPSANRSTRLSPTTAGHVRRDLGDAVDLILDGGPCRVGIESTVIDLTAAQPTILRPGGISRQQIEHIIGPVLLSSGRVDPSVAAISPGQQTVHYAPVAPAYRVEAGRWPPAQWWAEHAGQHWAALTLTLAVGDATIPTIPAHFIRMPSDPADYARRLYATLRQVDDPNVAAILIEMPPDTPQWTAIRDRLRRATVPLPGDAI